MEKSTIISSIGVILIFVISATMYVSDYRRILDENPDKMYFLGQDFSQGLPRAQVVIRNVYSEDIDFTRYQIDNDWITMYSDRSIVAKFRPQISYFKTYGVDEWVQLTRKASLIEINYYEDTEKKEVVVERVIPYYATKSRSGTGGTLYENFTIGQNTYKISYYWEPAGNRINYRHRLIFNVHDLEELGTGEISGPAAQFWEGDIPILVGWEGTEEYFSHTEIDGDEFNIYFEGKGAIILDPEVSVGEIVRPAEYYGEYSSMTSKTPGESVNVEYVDEPFLEVVDLSYECVNRDALGDCTFLDVDFDIRLKDEFKALVIEFDKCSDDECRLGVYDESASLIPEDLTNCSEEEYIVQKENTFEFCMNNSAVEPVWSTLYLDKSDKDVVCRNDTIPAKYMNRTVCPKQYEVSYSEFKSRITEYSELEYENLGSFFVSSVDNKDLYIEPSSFSMDNAPSDFEFKISNHSIVVAATVGTVYSANNSYTKFIFDSSKPADCLKLYGWNGTWIEMIDKLLWAGHDMCDAGVRQFDDVTWHVDTDDVASLGLNWTESANWYGIFNLTLRRGRPEFEIKQEKYHITGHVTEVWTPTLVLDEDPDLIYIPNMSVSYGDDSIVNNKIPPGNVDGNYMVWMEDSNAVVVSFSNTTVYDGETWGHTAAPGSWDWDQSNKRFKFISRYYAFNSSALDDVDRYMWFTPLMGIDTTTKTYATDDSGNDGSGFGLEGFWKMDEASGATAVDSAQSNDLTYNAADGDEWVSGTWKNAVNFGTTSDDDECFYTNDTSAYAENTVGTITFWLDATDDGWDYIPFGFYEGDGDSNTKLEFHAEMTAGNRWHTIWLYIDNVQQWEIKSTSVTVNAYAMYTLRHNGSFASFFRNGIEVGEIVQSADNTTWLVDILTDATDPANALSFGCKYFDGDFILEFYSPRGHNDFDDIRIYDRALTDSEILALFNKGVPDCFDKDFGCTFWNYDTTTSTTPNGSWANITSAVTMAAPSCSATTVDDSVLLGVEPTVVVPGVYNCSFTDIANDDGVTPEYMTTLPFEDAIDHGLSSYITAEYGSWYFDFTVD